MPHLTLEYTDSIENTINFKELFGKFHRNLANAGVRLGNCKSRARKVDTFVVGDGEQPGAFIHLDVRLLEGRSDDWKTEIGAKLLREIEGVLPEQVEPEGLQVTVEIRDIRRSAYFKHPGGTLEY